MSRDCGDEGEFECTVSIWVHRSWNAINQYEIIIIKVSGRSCMILVQTVHPVISTRRRQPLDLRSSSVHSLVYDTNTDNYYLAPLNV